MTEQTPDEQARRNAAPALRAAAFSIRAELLARALWAPVSIVILFVGIALTDVLPALPDIVHAAVLTFLAVLFGFSLQGAKTAFRPVSGEEAARRVESASGLKHRPLTALFDRPASAKLTTDGVTMWNTHLQRTLDATTRLSAPAPSPGLAAIDTNALRFIPVLVLMVGVLIGGADPFGAFKRAISPIGGDNADVTARIDLWITPPSYTGLAPMVFQGLGQPTIEKEGEQAASIQPTEPQTLIVPVGSQVLVHATDAGSQPRLRIGEVATDLPQLGDTDSESYKLEMTIGADFVVADELALDIGRDEIAAWPVRIAPDRAPTVEYSRAPTTRRDTQLDVEYLASDDYGIKTVTMRIRRPGGQRWPGGEDTIIVDVPLSGDNRNIETAFQRDFSAHPWAGLPVRVQLTATDTADQSAETEQVETVLPERIFNHPVARSLAEARKTLNDFDEDIVELVAEDLRGLSLRPAQFFDDVVAFLSIRSAYGRLAYNAYPDDLESNVASVQKLLWETALRIEDGEFALAEADLMRLQEEAMQALREGKIGEELERVMQELQEAMSRYMEALAERMQELGLDQMPQMGADQQMQAQDMQEMMDRIQEMAQTGNTEAAEQMLAQMQQMLEQLRQGMQMQQNNPAMAEARRLMDELRSLTEDQEQLLDQTFRESQRQRDQQSSTQRPFNQRGQRQDQQRRQQGQQQQGQQRQQNQQDGQQQGQQAGRQDGEQGSPTAQDQEELRRRLGELMRQMDEAFGQIPDNMGRAEQQMEQAGRNMGKGEFRDATGNQTQALQELREATNQMSQALAQQFGAQMGVTAGNQPQPGGQQGTDPFGRRQQSDQENGQGTAVDDDDVTVPDVQDIRRAREIIDELRRRAGEQHRPQIELDYIDRLLDIF